MHGHYNDWAARAARCNRINTRRENLITHRERVSSRYPIFVRASYTSTMKIWVKTFGNRRYMLLQRVQSPAIYRQEHLIIAGCISSLFPSRSMSHSDVSEVTSRIGKEISDSLIGSVCGGRRWRGGGGREGGNL